MIDYKLGMVLRSIRGTITCEVTELLENGVIKFNVYNGGWNAYYDTVLHKMQYLNHPLKDKSWFDHNYEFEVVGQRETEK